MPIEGAALKPVIRNVASSVLGGEAIGFLPTDLNNLELWLNRQDVSSITKDMSNKVSNWADKSGNNHDASQLTALDQPLFIVSPDAINFDGVDDFMSFSNKILLANDFTIFYDYSRIGGAFEFITGDTIAGQKIGFTGTTGSPIFFIRIITSADISIAAFGPGVRGIVTITRDSSNKVDLYLNSGAANRLNGDVAQVGTHQIGLLCVDETVGVINHYLDGNLFNAIIYDRKLPDAERTLVLNYLAGQ